MNLTGPFPGVVTTRDNWLITPTGDNVRALWAPCWRIVSDDMVGRALTEAREAQPPINFESREHWALVAYADASEDSVLAVVPGCIVAGFIACAEPPAGAVAYDLTE